MLKDLYEKLKAMKTLKRDTKKYPHTKYLRIQNGYITVTNTQTDIVYPVSIFDGVAEAIYIVLDDIIGVLSVFDNLSKLNDALSVKVILEEGALTIQQQVGVELKLNTTCLDSYTAASDKLALCAATTPVVHTITKAAYDSIKLTFSTTKSAATHDTAAATKYTTFRDYMLIHKEHVTRITSFVAHIHPLDKPVDTISSPLAIPDYVLAYLERSRDVLQAVSPYGEGDLNGGKFTGTLYHTNDGYIVSLTPSVIVPGFERFERMLEAFELDGVNGDAVLNDILTDSLKKVVAKSKDKQLVLCNEGIFINSVKVVEWGNECDFNVYTSTGAAYYMSVLKTCFKQGVKKIVRNEDGTRLLVNLGNGAKVVLGGQNVA